MFFQTELQQVFSPHKNYFYFFIEKQALMRIIDGGGDYLY